MENLTNQEKIEVIKKRNILLALREFWEDEKNLDRMATELNKRIKNHAESTDITLEDKLVERYVVFPQIISSKNEHLAAREIAQELKQITPKAHKVNIMRLGKALSARTDQKVQQLGVWRYRIEAIVENKDQYLQNKAVKKAKKQWKKIKKQKKKEKQS